MEYPVHMVDRTPGGLVLYHGANVLAADKAVKAEIGISRSTVQRATPKPSRGI